MPNARINLVSLSLVVLSLPIWGLVAYEVQLRNGAAGNVRAYLFPLLILCVLTAAIHRLMCHYPNAWPISALLAGIGTLGFLMWAAG
jgi:hypothetical protein